jgi:hypothetical protein
MVVLLVAKQQGKYLSKKKKATVTLGRLARKAVA